MTTVDTALVRRFIRRAQDDQSRLARMVNDLALSILAAQITANQVGDHPPEFVEADRLMHALIEQTAEIGILVEEANSVLREWEWATNPNLP